MRRPFTIGIGGTRSGSGKTTAASSLLKILAEKNNFSAIGQKDISSSIQSKLKPVRRWGAIKYSKTEFYSSITVESEILGELGKDTHRLMEAGAEEVVWVQSPTEVLDEVMPIALERLYHLDGILIEGNSAIEFVKPDVIVLVSGGGSMEIKPSAWKILENADIIIMSYDSPLINYPDSLKNSKVFTLRDFQEGISGGIIKEVIDYMDILVNMKRAKELLIERSVDQKITCGDARKIAEETGLPYYEVGRIADDLKVKIRDCELGCF